MQYQNRATCAFAGAASALFKTTGCRNHSWSLLLSPCPSVNHVFGSSTEALAKFIAAELGATDFSSGDVGPSGLPLPLATALLPQDVSTVVPPLSVSPDYLSPLFSVAPPCSPASDLGPVDSDWLAALSSPSGSTAASACYLTPDDASLEPLDELFPSENDDRPDIGRIASKRSRRFSNGQSRPCMSNGSETSLDEPTRGGSKRRRRDDDANSPAPGDSSGSDAKYLDYRSRNNLAVKKCRAARKQKIDNLVEENESLRRELKNMRALLVAKDAEISAYKGLLNDRR